MSNRPFDKRFNIPVDLKDAQHRFRARVLNGIYRAFPPLEVVPLDFSYFDVMRHVADRLGVIFNDIFFGPSEDFYKFLKWVEALYEGILEYQRGKELLVQISIELAFSMSEVDLGIQWKDGVFWPSGAKLLDEELVNKNLEWLDDPKYRNVLVPFERGLRHYLEANKEPAKLTDTTRDMYEAMEAMARIINKATIP